MTKSNRFGASRAARLVAVAVAGAFVFASVRAEAYHSVSHQRITELGWQVMAATRGVGGGMPTTFQPPLRSVPPGADPAEWALYLQDLDRAITTLPRVIAGIDPSSAPPSECVGSPYPPGDAIRECRVRELLFAPNQDWKIGNENSCHIDRSYTAGGIYESLYDDLEQQKFGGMVLGRLAVIPDDDLSETRLWIRPTNLGPIEHIIDGLSTGAEAGLTLFFALGLCAGSLLSGGSLSDCLDDARDLARDHNPIEILRGMIPGIDIARSADYVGFWHHIHVDSGAGEFNDIRGLHYDVAGPRIGGSNRSGALDMAISVVADLMGLGLHVGESNGVRRYELLASEIPAGEPSPSRPRGTEDWQGEEFPHVEMNPLDNFAEFGWNEFLSNPSTLRFLARPLHAIGDATVPMHVVGSTAWGHVPFEKAVDNNWFPLIFQNPLEPDGDYTQEELDNQFRQAHRVLEEGFRWWRFVRAFRQANPQWGRMPIRPLITELARETNDRARFLLNDAASTFDAINGVIGFINGAVEFLSDVFGTEAAAQALADLWVFQANAAIDVINQGPGPDLPHVPALDVNVIRLSQIPNVYDFMLPALRDRIEAAAGVKVAFLTLVGAEFAVPLPETATTPCPPFPDLPDPPPDPPPR